MRVLHVSPYFPPAIPYGGPPASVLGLCQALQRAGVDVDVLTTTANGDAPLAASPAGGDRFDGVPVRYVATSFPRRFFGARVREPLIAGLARADVCHIHGVWNVPEWWASYLARARKVPYVVSPRGMLQPQAVRQGRWRKRVAYRLLDRANLRGAALLHATSEQEADALRDLQLGVPIAVVPNGVDLDAAPRAPRGYRSHLGIPSDALVVLYLGRMHRIKRLDLVADAFAALRTTNPSAHLVLAGHDEQGLIPDLTRRLSAHAPFVHVLEKSLPELRHVSGSNACHLAVRYDARTGRAVCLSALDNLVKGAAGSAMQNMNLICGLDQTTGLRHAATGP